MPTRLRGLRRGRLDEVPTLEALPVARRADLGPELQRIGAADGAERDERAAHGRHARRRTRTPTRPRHSRPT